LAAIWQTPGKNVEEPNTYKEPSRRSGEIQLTPSRSLAETTLKHSGNLANDMQKPSKNLVGA
jgi:hypothetical protein